MFCLNTKNHGLSKTLFYTKTVLYTKALHKNHFLARPVQALFAACRIALSMEASRTRRRRLNVLHSRLLYVWQRAPAYLDWTASFHARQLVLSFRLPSVLLPPCLVEFLQALLQILHSTKGLEDMRRCLEPAGILKVCEKHTQTRTEINTILQTDTELQNIVEYMEAKHAYKHAEGGHTHTNASSMSCGNS